jgi:histidyl-tRNA synthetase
LVISKGTRDFSPIEMKRRNYIFNVITKIFKRYGFEQIETPAMENLSTLMGKYGDEGDRLIFKILNSGDYLKKVDDEILETKDSNKLTKYICEKALRYDLTVPFARYVVMHQNDITFPFKRFQIQPVWRADRPQKGRYREFYQCDADIIGSDSLLNEVDLIKIFDDVLTELKIPEYTIHINNRKILSGLAEIFDISDRIIDFTVAVDKLDKIGKEGVLKELQDKNFTSSQLKAIESFLNEEPELEQLKKLLQPSETGLKGVEELNEVLQYINNIGLKTAKIKFDVTLARGLNYYTGAIFEVKVKDFPSICGGGRYDDLTGVFGIKGLSGVGISFGADRIYDIMLATNAFPDFTHDQTEVLFINFGKKETDYCLPLLFRLREKNINAELYPDTAKMKKQMKFANDKGVKYVVMAGENEMQENTLTLKNMSDGSQKTIDKEEFFKLFD